jgi:hypothetical protein
MPKGLNTRENQAKQSVLIADTMAGAGKGMIQAFPGLPGDLESIGRMALGYLGYNVDENTVLPTSEEIGKRLESVLGPVVPKENTLSSLIAPSEFQAERERAAKGGETLGEIVSPGGQIALASKVAKPVIGATKKIIEAGKDLPVGMSIKGVDESLDPLGFYSAASKAVDNIQQPKGTGAQFLAQIEKTPGVKKEELLWTGLDEFLAGKKSVTKAEVQDYLNTNRVEVKETTLGEPTHEWQGNFLMIGKTAVAKLDEAEDGSYVLRDTINNKTIPLESNRLDKAVAEAEDAYGVRGMVTPYEGKPKFAKYQLPGGENYREVMLTMPNLNVQKFDPSKVEIVRNRQSATQGTYTIKYDGKEIQTYGDEFNVKDGYKGLSDNEIMQTAKDLYEKGNKFQQIKPMSGEFRSQHFDQPNVLAHMRLNDRVDADGKKVLFVEEVQSDWHQAGRKKGYETPGKIEQLKQEVIAAKNELRSNESALAEKYGLPKKGDATTSIDSRMKWTRDLLASMSDEEIAVRQALEGKIKDAEQAWATAGKGVPDAPFKTSWHELALKRAIQLASEGGYDRIAFTTGKTQAERYDLSKQISELRLSKDGELKARTSQNPAIFTSIASNVTPDNLADYVGKEAAKKLLDATPNDVGAKNLKGVDLQVGGEGMKGFYDTILPKYLDKYGKKWDAKVGMTKIRLATDAQDTADSKLLKDLGMDEGGQAAASVHYMDITPKMKESVLTKGQPLFQMAPAIPAGAAGTQMQEENK